MKHLRVNNADMAYLDIGAGRPLVCVHGSLGDFRVWSSVLGPLSRRHRVIALSLRHFFPEQWNGRNGRYTIAQHVADVIAFIETLDLGAVDLMGHSRGGHIAFRVAQQRPELLRKLVLAEPGGALDASLAPTAMPASSLGAPMQEAANLISMGDIDGGLETFIDAIDGKGLWRRLPAAAKQEHRDNAHTILGQINEQRQPYSRADAEAIRTPTLFVAGAKTKGSLPIVLRTLAQHVAGSQIAVIPNTTHFMFGQDPVGFSAAVMEFLDV